MAQIIDLTFYRAERNDMSHVYRDIRDQRYSHVPVHLCACPTKKPEPTLTEKWFAKLRKWGWPL